MSLSVAGHTGDATSGVDFQLSSVLSLALNPRDPNVHGKLRKNFHIIRSKNQKQKLRCPQKPTDYDVTVYGVFTSRQCVHRTGDWMNTSEYTGQYNMILL